MLQKLTIHNYVIIDHLVIEPDGQLNIVTGETGAGKSIILGALSLILGERADTSVLIRKEDKCIVEAVFSITDNHAFREALRAEDLDGENECIIRREINSKGKSRAFVNDTPVTLTILEKLTSLLVDLHQQFDHLDIRNAMFQLQVVDALAKNSQLKQEYKKHYRHYQQTKLQLEENEQLQSKLSQEEDYKQYLLDELVHADFSEHEIENAAQELKQMTHSEKILEALQSVRYLLEEGEQPMTAGLRRAGQQLQGISELVEDGISLVSRIESARVELADIADEITRLEDKIVHNPQRMEALQQRVDMGYKLLKKHAAEDTAGLLAIRHTLETDLEKKSDLAGRIAGLRAELDTHYGVLSELAASLSERRRQTAPSVAEQVTRLLILMGMPNARFEVHTEQIAEPGPEGIDNVKFLLDANRSGKMESVYKAASGGEMSRIMLAVKSVTAKAMHLPVLVFDEVDTGISGEAARQVGLLLRELAGYHQIICITHQPQVAAKGTRHFYVYKEDNGDSRIQTRIRILSEKEHVHEIARMIGGDPPTAAALKHAGELVADA